MLEDQFVDSYIKNKCKHIPNHIENYGLLWYECFIEDIIKMLKRESRRLNTLKKEKINSLYYDLNVLYNQNDLDSNTKNEIENDLKTQLDNYYNSVRLGIEKRACEIKRNFIFQPSKILIEKEIKNSRTNYIKDYQCENDNITNNIEDIIDDLSSFYIKLMSNDRVETGIFDNYNFKIKSILDKDKKLFLDYDLDYKEFNECIFSMKGAAPGPNGLTLGLKVMKILGVYFDNIRH